MTGLWSVIRCMKGAAKCRSYSALIYTILLLFYVASLNATAPNIHVNKNRVTTVKECQKFLCKYGYFKERCECHIKLKRQRRSLNDDDLFPSEFPSENPSEQPQMGASDVLDLSDDDTTLTGVCNDSDFTIALKVFQKNFGLTLTGVCDNHTRHQMSQRRCGQPDNDVTSPKNESVGEEKTDRQTRSLRDVLLLPIQSDQYSDRRRRQLLSYIEEIRREEVTPKKLHEFAQQKNKRSTLDVSVSDDYGGILSQRKITWRLMTAHRTGDRTVQRSILRQAFAYWSEVLPLCFEEKDRYPMADIEIGFLEGAHLTCFRQFDGSGGEIAHKYFRDVHFDNSEQYYMTEGGRGDMDTLLRNPQVINDSVSLLLAATHELGHVIGLNHSTSVKSIMNPVYHEELDNSFELSSFDRKMALEAYGPCKGSFDEVFDYVRYENGKRVFNTHFFRHNIYWMYENQLQRPRANYPGQIASWDIEDVNGNEALVTQDIDSFLHYFDVRYNPVHDEHYFFRGDRYFKYDASASDSSNKILESGSISSKFPPGTYVLPNSPDAVFYDYRDKTTYFFKGEYVYLYKYSTDTAHSCCDSKERIISVFPPQSRSVEESPTGNSYSSNIDSVYYSWHFQELFFIKGEDVWKNVKYDIHGTKQDNSMVYQGKWWNIWKFICDTDCES